VPGGGKKRHRIVNGLGVRGRCRIAEGAEGGKGRSNAKHSDIGLVEQ